MRQLSFGWIKCEWYEALKAPGLLLLFPQFNQVIDAIFD
jgi:hypothetical protein